MNQPTALRLLALSLVAAAAACADPTAVPNVARATAPHAAVAPRALAASMSTDAAIAAVVGGSAVDADRDGVGDGIDDSQVSAAQDDALNGRFHLHWEWDIRGMSGIASARVRLTTWRGSVDSLPTELYAATGDGDGMLTAADFGTAVAPLGVPMPVADGAPGTFEFDVTDALRAAVAQGRSYLVLEGRVPAGTTGRGLQVFTTFMGVPASEQPTLLVTSAPAATPTQAIADLRASVAAAPLAAPLLRKLTGALDDATDALAKGRTKNACGDLATFQTQVQVQRGKGIPAASADAWLGQVAAIRASLGC